MEPSIEEDPPKPTSESFGLTQTEVLDFEQRANPVNIFIGTGVSATLMSILLVWVASHRLAEAEHDFPPLVYIISFILILILLLNISFHIVQTFTDKRDIYRAEQPDWQKYLRYKEAQSQWKVTVESNAKARSENERRIRQEASNERHREKAEHAAELKARKNRLLTGFRHGNDADFSDLVDLINIISTRDPELYKIYLRTNHWKRIRREALEAAGNACEKCKSKEGVQVHHRTYKNLGSERPKDLVVLCREHHEIIHEQRERLKHRGRRHY